MGANLRTVEVGFLRKQNHSLSKPIRLIEKETQAIVEKLMKLIDSTDEKIAKDACDILLTHLAKMTEQRDRDEILRRMAHLKHGGGKSFETEEEDDTPIICFDQIQEV